MEMDGKYVNIFSMICFGVFEVNCYLFIGHFKCNLESGNFLFGNSFPKVFQNCYYQVIPADGAVCCVPSVKLHIHPCLTVTRHFENYHLLQD